MNTLPRDPLPQRSPITLSRPASARRPYPERDFGIGYGRSSGYAAPRRYAMAWAGQPLFRCR